ncbi:hypothetical protein AS593_03585 [Caulobacter vibrioides]|nr:hypothetical protein AS593_03585 [Caulobacter vibrioides]
MSDGIWDVLGIEPTRDRDVIRRAYARKLRATNPEDDAEGFMRLREAHDEAVQRAKYDWFWEDQDEDEDDEAFGDETADAGDLLVRVEPARIDAAPLPSGTAEAEELQVRLERLEMLLRQADRPPAAEMEAAFHAVLNAEALDELALADAVEDRIADLLLAVAPRSDPLLLPAVAAFRWRRDDLRFMPSPTVAAVLERADFVESRDRMLKFDDYGAKAIEILQGPPSTRLSWLKRLDPGYDRAMKDILGRIGDDNGALMADFNPETVAAWRAHYGRTRLSPAMGASVAIAALVGLLAGIGLDRGPLVLVAATLVPPALVAGGLLAYFFGYRRLKLAWDIHRAWRAGPWERLGWVPASLAVLAGSALLPDGAIGAALAAALCAPVLLWMALTVSPSPEGVIRQKLLPQIVPIAWIGSLILFVPDAVKSPMLVALVAAIVVDLVSGVFPAQAWHLDMRPAPRLAAVLALIVAALGLGFMVFRTMIAPEAMAPWQPLCVAMILALAIGHRPAVATVGGPFMQARYYIMIALFWGGRAIDIGPNSWFLVSAAWMLVGIVIGLGAALISREAEA